LANQASAGSNSESDAIFVAISTSNRVAVLRTLPEIVTSASETRGLLFRQRVQTITHVVEFAELRAESKSKARGTQLSRKTKKKELQVG
jgi:hypothetical protein